MQQVYVSRTCNGREGLFTGGILCMGLPERLVGATLEQVREWAKGCGFAVWADKREGT